MRFFTVLLFIAVLIFLFSCSEKQESKSNNKTAEELQNERVMKYKVKSVIVKKYETEDLDKWGSLYNLRNYDENGNIIRNIEIRDIDEDNMNEIYRYKYYSKGNIMIKFSYSIEKDENELEDTILGIKWSYKYDSLTGKKIEEKAEGDISITETFKYNNNGKLIEKSSVDFESPIDKLKKSWQTFFDYDNNGILIKETKKYQNKEPYTSVSYEYNKFGNLSKKIEYADNNKVFKTTYYKYDSQGNLINEERIYNDSKYKIYSNFDDKGNVIEIKESEYDAELEKTFHYHWKFTYEPNGLLSIERSLKDNDELGSLLKYSYEFYH